MPVDGVLFSSFLNPTPLYLHKTELSKPRDYSRSALYILVIMDALTTVYAENFQNVQIFMQKIYVLLKGISFIIP